MFSNWLTPTATNAPPPDVVLEIGPPPYSRYAAHSALLSAHSGYLRSAIRPEDRNFDNPIYLPNITAEQFAPLLTYMYTGFLDLSIENIFGVLLATHVLHMPRALEICRSFLARTQAEGYLGGAFLPTMADMLNEKSGLSTPVKIIRPIASKASAGTGLGFVAPPVSSILLPSCDTQFKSLHQDRERSPLPSTSKISPPPAAAPPPPPTQQLKPSTATTPTISQPKLRLPPKEIFHKKIIKTTKRQILCDEPKIVKQKCDIVEDPIKLTDDDNPNKTIIDIASCDGPVRFRRVLNDAYGRSNNNPTASATATIKSIERNQQNLATSFHLQMAKTISEQRQRTQQSYEESENSQEIIVVQDTQEPADLSGSVDTNNLNNNKSEEVYSCVYCKHTFKSQYCYQKHAKRHINPLSIDGELVVETIDSGSEKDEKGSSSGSNSGANPVTLQQNNKTMRREVRPLDMNVQYYPCKTCGSKFPSYYFVHKHRKMCHANEEN